MSAFLVDKTTIDRIVSLISHECVSSAYLKRELEKELTIDFADIEWRTRLGQKMLDLNQLALGYRYGDKELKLRYVYSDVSMLVSRIQLFKSLQCWMYQCMEGDLPEKSKLFKVFKEKIVTHFALSIVQSMPEYDEAEWA